MRPHHRKTRPTPSLEATTRALDAHTLVRTHEVLMTDGPREWSLVILAGNNLGRIYSLAPGDNLIGRQAGLPIAILDGEASRRHAVVRLSRVGEEWAAVLEDLGSTNGTFLNGEPLHGVVRLNDGDRITIGNHIFKLVILDPLEKNFHQTLINQSMLDTLTGLSNRATTLGELQSHFQLAVRYERPLSLVMIDLDHFKLINDELGHPMGDLVLQIFASRLGQALRETDIAGRIGGEEFLLVLPETDREGAKILAERIRSLVADEAFALPATPRIVTSSYGVAERRKIDLEPGELLARADAALYRAKRSGRNRVEVAE